MSDHVSYTIGSSNVFAELDLPHPEERLAKTKLAYRICKLVEGRGWGVVDASNGLGMDESGIAALLNGRLATFSLGRLIRLLNALDQDVEILVRPNRSPDRPAVVTVVTH